MSGLSPTETGCTGNSCRRLRKAAGESPPGGLIPHREGVPGAASPRECAPAQERIASLEGVCRTAVRVAELETLMLISSRGCPLVTMANGPLLY